MIAWQFKLLGQPEIWHHQAQIEDFNTQKTQALLYFLVAEGVQHNRNDLARFFWDDFNLVSSQNNLRTTLYHLKQDFEPCLEIDRQCVAFSLPESAYLDLALVDAIRPDSDLEALCSAAEAYRGDFLECYTTTIPNFEVWKEEKQANYRQKIIKYLLRLAELHEKEGQTQQCLAAARRILEIDPINEAGILLHMRLLTEMGLHERAIQSYHDYGNALKKQPDGQPSPQIKAFYTKLKMPHFTLARSSLPFIESDVFGREAETNQLISWLTDPTIRWINLAGHSGVGKSFLAISASEKVEGNFKDGISYLDLRGFNAGDPDFNVEIFSKLALATMRVRIVLGKDYQTQLRKALTHREMLIILDHFTSFPGWHVFVNEILLSNPKIKLLVISHQGLEFPDGVILNLAGLTFPRLEALPSKLEHDFISRYPSLQMFEDRAQQIVPGFKIDQSNYRQIAIMCGLVQGLPIGIEYITHLLPKSSIDQILAAMLGNTSQDPILAVEPTLSTKLETVLDYVWSNLEPDIKDLTLASSLFKGAFSPANFSAVTMKSSDQLIRLVEAALLYAVSKEHFKLHDLVRVYLDKKGFSPSDPFAKRYRDYFLQMLIRLDQSAQNGPYPIETLTHKFADLLHAWALALEHESFELIAQSCAPLARAYQQMGLAKKAVIHFEQVAEQIAKLADPPNTARSARGHILVEAARLAIDCGQVSPARRLAEKAAKIAQLLKAPSLTARCCQRLAEINNGTRRPRVAIKYAQDGVSEAITAGDEHLAAELTITLGKAYCANLQYGKALSTYQSIINDKHDGEGSRTLLSVYVGMLTCLKAQGRFDQALRISKKTQQINEILQDALTDARLAFICGEIQKFLGQFDAALASFSQTSTAFASVNSCNWQALSLANLGILHNWRGEYSKALHNLEEAENLAMRNNLSALAEILAIKAQSLLAAGYFSAARKILQSTGLDVSAENESQNFASPIITAKINLALAEGDHKTAENLASRLLPEIKLFSYDGIGDPFSIYLSMYHALKDNNAPSAQSVLLHTRQALTHLHTHLPAGVKVNDLLALPHRRELANIIQEQLENPTLV